MSAVTLAELRELRREVRDELVELLDEMMVDDCCTVDMVITTRDREAWERFGKHVGPRDTLVTFGALASVTCRLHEDVAL